MMGVLFPPRVYHVLSPLIPSSLLVQESATKPTILNGVTCYVIKDQRFYIPLGFQQRWISKAPVDDDSS